MGNDEEAVFENLSNDGFWDVDVVGEKLGVPADGPGRNIELQHGMPYPYAIQRAHLTFKNPGNK